MRQKIILMMLRKKIAKTLRVQDKEILFTSGGTESNNTAIIGAAMVPISVQEGISSHLL